MEAVHIKAELAERQRELHETLTLAKEQLRQLQVTFHCELQLITVAFGVHR